MSSSVPVVPASTGVIAPAVNDNPGLEPVPEPDPVAGYKRGSSNTRFVNDKSTKLHCADWAPPIALMEPQPPHRINVRRITSRRSYVSSFQGQNPQGRPMFLPAGAVAQAASYWHSYAQSPVPSSGCGNLMVPGVPQEQPLIDHPFPMDTLPDGQNVVFEGPQAIQNTGLQETTPLGVRHGSMPPHAPAPFAAPPQYLPQQPMPIPPQQPAPIAPIVQPPVRGFMQTTPLGVRQGSVPPHGANDAAFSTSSQPQHQGFAAPPQAPPQQPAPIVQPSTAGQGFGQVPVAPHAKSSALAELAASLATLRGLVPPPPPSHNAFVQSSAGTAREQPSTSAPSAFDAFRFPSSSTSTTPQKVKRRTAGRSASAQPTSSNPQSASKGKERARAPSSAAPATGTPQVHNGFGFQFMPNTVSQVGGTPQGTFPPSASQHGGALALTSNDIVQIWESLPMFQKDAMLSAYTAGQAAPQFRPSTVLLPGQQAPIGQHPEQLLDTDHEMGDETNATINKNWPTMRPTAAFTGLSMSPEGASHGGFPRPSGPAQAPPSGSHVTVLLLNKMDAVGSRLDSHTQTQGEMAENLRRVHEQLSQIQVQRPVQAPIPHMVPVTAFPTPPPRSRGRASRSKSARIYLATAKFAASSEHEDFSAELRQIDEEEEEEEEEEGEEAATGGSGASSHDQWPSSARRGGVRSAFVSTDGWVMPPIPQTTEEEEANMVAMMTSKQATQAELTFARHAQDAVRRHMLGLLRISSLDEVGAKCPTLTDEEFDEWMATKPDCTPSMFGIDFKRSWAKCAYNRAARDYFTRHFLESVSGRSYKQPPTPSRYFTIEQVRLALDSHMDHARVRWRQQINPPKADVVQRRRVDKQNNMRKATLYVWRTWTVSVYGLSQHVQLFLRLKPVHMSGDEAEDEESDRAGLYTIIEAAWQSDPLKTFLRTLDSRYVKGWADCVGDRGRGGKRPRLRVAKASDAKVVDSVAPIGLWHCYNAEWVKWQDAWLIHNLCIINEDYDFSLDFSNGPAPGEVAAEMQKTMMQAAGLEGTNTENGQNGQNGENGESGDMEMTTA